MLLEGVAFMREKIFEGGGLKYLVLEPDGYEEGREYPVVILMHGYGSSMSDLAALCPIIDRKGYLYVCPNAPIRIDVGPGMEGYSWMPLGDEGWLTDDVGAEEKLDEMFEEIKDRYKVGSRRVILGGFSQGGMMSYWWGLRNHDLFGGLIALSSRVPDPGSLKERLPSKHDQSIFVAHGTEDTMISVDNARDSVRFLEMEGYKPEYKEYAMGHQITEQVLEDLVSWI